MSPSEVPASILPRFRGHTSGSPESYLERGATLVSDLLETLLFWDEEDKAAGACGTLEADSWLVPSSRLASG